MYTHNISDFVQRDHNQEEDHDQWYTIELIQFQAYYSPLIRILKQVQRSNHKGEPSYDPHPHVQESLSQVQRSNHKGEPSRDPQPQKQVQKRNHKGQLPRKLQLHVQELLKQVQRRNHPKGEPSCESHPQTQELLGEEQR